MGDRPGRLVGHQLQGRHGHPSGQPGGPDLARSSPGSTWSGPSSASIRPQVTVGQEVIVHGYDLGVAHHGGFSQVARVPAGWVVPLPAGLTARRAAVIGTAGFTAALSLHRLEHHGLTPGDGPVLVTGASGGVGSMAVALLAGRGYGWWPAPARPRSATYLLGLGAAEVIDRDDLDVAPERTLGPERWAGAVDCVGGSTLTAVLRDPPLRSRRGRQRPHRGEHVRVLGLSVHRPRRLADRCRYRPDPDRRTAGGLGSAGHGLPPDLSTAWSTTELGLDRTPARLSSSILAGGVRGRMLVRPAG